MARGRYENEGAMILFLTNTGYIYPILKSMSNQFSIEDNIDLLHNAFIALNRRDQQELLEIRAQKYSEPCQRNLAQALANYYDEARQDGRSYESHDCLLEEANGHLAKAQEHFNTVNKKLNFRKEPGMFEPIVKTVTFVYNDPIQDLSKDELLAVIEKLEEQKRKLNKLETKSKAIAAQVKEIEAALATIVARLDEISDV